MSRSKEAEATIAIVLSKLTYNLSNKSILGNKEYALPELAMDRNVTRKSGDRKGEVVVIHSSVDKKEQELLSKVVASIKREPFEFSGKKYTVESTQGGDFKEVIIREKVGTSIDDMLAAIE